MKQHQEQGVDNLQLQEKKQHNDSIGRNERQKLNSLVHSTLSQKGHFRSERSERKRSQEKKGAVLHIGLGLDPSPVHNLDINKVLRQKTLWEMTHSCPVQGLRHCEHEKQFLNIV